MTMLARVSLRAVAVTFRPPLSAHLFCHSRLGTARTHLVSLSHFPLHTTPTSRPSRLVAPGFNRLPIPAVFPPDRYGILRRLRTSLSKSIRSAKASTKRALQPLTQRASSGGQWGGRRGNDPLTPTTVLYGVIGVNVGVFLLWQYARGNAQSYHDQSSLRFMMDNFMLSYNNVIGEHRWWTMLTAAVSHVEALHLGLNMFVLHSFGSAVLEFISPRQFLLLYAVAGLTSSAASLFRQSRLPPYERANTKSLGASGSVTGITLLFALMFPTATINVMFIPVPAMVGIGTSGRVDSAGHIGGAVAGLAYWYLKIRGRGIGRW
ncbi:hypothetical protein DFJ77DRAFT_439812 [Powellomyces hirtus]|nr:hypothetical protein DFJ77DRAFT_439812 [Powellomyces hirtus]